jgi:adrenodoxin-NADP+ reductase
LNELMAKADTRTVENPDELRRTLLRFNLSPHRFLESTEGGLLEGVEFSHTRFIDSDGTPLQQNDPRRHDPDARVAHDPTKPPLPIPAQLAFRSIGYKSEPMAGMLDLGLPFDSRAGLIPNVGGRVLDPACVSEPAFLPGFYVAGWAKRGPTGVIASTMADAFETADAIVEDINRLQDFKTASSPPSGAGNKSSTGLGWEAIRKELPPGARPVSWQDWQEIDRAEKAKGALLGKPREKFTSVDEMLRVLDG